MALAELVDDREQIFERPRTKQAVQQGRELVPVTRFADIVQALEHRKAGQAVLLHGFDIISSSFYSKQNFSKRGPLVKLETFNGDENQLRAKEWSDLKARIESSQKYSRKDGPYTGWCWVDPEERYHIVHPTTVVEGHRLLMHAVKSRNIAEQIEHKNYGAKDSNLRAVRVKVPSRSERKKHEVVIEHVTGLDDPERFVEWTRLETRHECPHKRNDFSFRFKKSVTYCPHDVAAYAAHARRVAEQSHRIIFQPFPLFTEPFLRLYFGAAYHTLKVDVLVDRTIVRTKTRPLTLAEIDPILMDAWQLHGNKQTLFVRSPTRQYKTGPPVGQRKRMRDYDWSPDAPGLPFGNE